MSSNNPNLWIPFGSQEYRTPWSCTLIGGTTTTASTSTTSRETTVTTTPMSWLGVFRWWLMEMTDPNAQKVWIIYLNDFGDIWPHAWKRGHGLIIVPVTWSIWVCHIVQDWIDVVDRLISLLFFWTTFPDKVVCVHPSSSNNIFVGNYIDTSQNSFDTVWLISFCWEMKFWWQPMLSLFGCLLEALVGWALSKSWVS